MWMMAGDRAIRRVDVGQRCAAPRGRKLQSWEWCVGGRRRTDDGCRRMAYAWRNQGEAEEGRERAAYAESPPPTPPPPAPSDDATSELSALHQTTPVRRFFDDEFASPSRRSLAPSVVADTGYRQASHGRSRPWRRCVAGHRDLRFAGRQVRRRADDLFTEDATVWTPNMLAVSSTNSPRTLPTVRASDVALQFDLLDIFGSRGRGVPCRGRITGPFIIDEGGVIEPNDQPCWARRDSVRRPDRPSAPRRRQPPGADARRVPRAVRWTARMAQVEPVLDPLDLAYGTHGPGRSTAPEWAPSGSRSFRDEDRVVAGVGIIWGGAGARRLGRAAAPPSGRREHVRGRARAKRRAASWATMTSSCDYYDRLGSGSRGHRKSQVRPSAGTAGALTGDYYAVGYRTVGQALTRRSQDRALRSPARSRWSLAANGDAGHRPLRSWSCGGCTAARRHQLEVTSARTISARREIPIMWPSPS